MKHVGLRPLFSLYRIFLCELGNYHSSVGLALNRAKNERGATAHATCKTCFWSFTVFSFCELDSSHSSVALALTRFIRTQDGDDMQSTVSTKKFENHWPRTHVYSSSHRMRQN